MKEAIEAYRRALPEGELTQFRLDPIDYLDAPIVSVDLVVKDASGRIRNAYNGIGYGADETAATLGAYGELSEEAHLEESFYRLELEEGSYLEMTDQYGKDGVIDPLTLVLPAGSPYTPDYSLRWAPVERLADGARVWCPAGFVACNKGMLPDYPQLLTTSIRNGSGAGDTLERALLHGTLELLQRDGNADCFRALDRGKVIDRATLPGDIRELLESFERQGLHILPKLARVTCGVPSIYAAGDDRSTDTFPIGVTSTGEGADPDYRRALRKAIHEVASSHSRKRFNNLPLHRKQHLMPKGYAEKVLATLDLEKEERRALKGMVDWLQLERAELRALLDNNVFLEKEKIDAHTLPTFESTDIPTQWNYVRAQLEKEGLTPYVFRATTTKGECEVVKVIVPGIEQEFGSYYRVGYRGVERLLAEDPFQLLHRHPGEGRRRILLPATQERRLDGPFYLDTARIDALIDPVYPLYREPSAHAAALALERGYFAEEVTA